MYTVEMEMTGAGVRVVVIVTVGAGTGAGTGTVPSLANPPRSPTSTNAPACAPTAAKTRFSVALITISLI
jgi:hypothetical protein